MENERCENKLFLGYKERDRVMNSHFKKGIFTTTEKVTNISLISYHSMYITYLQLYF
jgi:hypothetical protein